MSKIYSLVIFIRGHSQPFHFVVDKSDHDRLSTILNSSKSPVSPSFFWCDTSDGRSAVINLEAVQAIRFLWDGAFGPRAQEAECDEPIKIYLRGRKEPVDADTDTAGSIYQFFSELEMDPKIFPFPSFIDSDGEYLYVQASEIDLVVAPKALMDEGARIALEELEEGMPRPKPRLVSKE